MKKIIVFISLFFFFMPLVFAAFSDVSQNYDFVQAIEYVRAKGIVNGYSDGTFQPDKTINRAEFTKIIIEAQFDKSEIDSCIINNIQSDAPYVFFPDVPKNAWFVKYICVAKIKNLIGGYPNGTFQPSNNISFVEAAKIIANGFNITQEGDVGSVWYAQFVDTLAKRKAIPSSIYNLGKFISRGEMAEMIWRLKENIQSANYSTFENNQLSPINAYQSPVQGLSWPINCKVGSTCSITGGFPDIDNDGKDAFCKPSNIPGHQGTDIGISWEQMDNGVDVYAAADGTINWVFDGKYDRCPNASEADCPTVSNPDGGLVCTESGPYCGDGLHGGTCHWCFAGGNVVVILHNGVTGVFATRYDHLKANSIIVRPGQFVKRGQKIAQVASAGHSTGPHLHFEVWGSGYYEVVDPWQGACSSAGHQSLWQDQGALL